MKYKKCSKCQYILKLENFNKNKCKKDKLNNICKECSKENSRKYYKENKKLHYKNILKRRKKYSKIAKEFILNYLLSNPCVDCGEKDPVVLDFDHIKGKKIFGIAKAVHYGYSLKVIKKEISKCQVRCSNCHRRKTSRENNGFWKERMLNKG